MEATQLIEKYCLKEDLATYDPYDIWKTRLGFIIKNGFNKNKWLYLLPATGLTIFDIYINNRKRLFYKKQEYPIVRALAATTLLNLYKKNPQKEYINFAQKHINWLLNHKAIHKNGVGWGINFHWGMKKDIIFSPTTPLSTHTPYVLEAMYTYQAVLQKDIFKPIIRQIFVFFEKDLNLLYNKNNMMAVSYGPYGNIIVNNATSYALFSYSIFYQTYPKEKQYIKDKITKFYNFLKYTQQENGSWLYAPFDSNSFIDCFHSALIIKNIIKTQQNVDFNLSNHTDVIQKGYSYIKNNMWNKNKSLFKRFSLSNKPGIIKFDLYDNAEMLNLSIMMNDYRLKEKLHRSIIGAFPSKDGIYSAIDIFGIKRNKDMLRWAVMPYLYSLSKV